MADNERAFEIHASPEIIWQTLLEEVHGAVDTGQATIEQQNPPHSLQLNVHMGWGRGVRYRYTLTGRSASTEVAVTVDPYGTRNALANIFSFGRGLTPYMLAVTQGLANLKEAAETKAGTSPTP